jgi:hypothetical protein
MAERSVDAVEVERPPADDREGVGESVSVAPGASPLRERLAEKIDIRAAVDAQDRLDPVIRRRLGRPDRAEDRVDPPLMLRRRMQLAVEEFGGWRMAPLSLVPEAPHGVALAQARQKAISASDH